MKTLLVAILPITMIAATPQRPLNLPGSSETIDVSIVNVDAFVTDRRGNRVHGLTRNDFEIFEDGKIQPITNFTEYASGLENENASAAGVEPALARLGTAVPPPPQQRTIIVFIDQGVGGKKIFANLKELLHRAVRPGDAVTILFWGRAAYVRQQFTDDLEIVDRMIDSMSGMPHPEFSGQEQIERERRWVQSIARRGPGLSVEDDFPGSDGIDAAFRQMRAKTHAINAVLESVSAVNGQKIMLLLTPRFSMFALRNEVRARTFPVLPTFRERMYSTRAFVESVARTANANGVTLYPLHPPGLGNDWTNAADPHVPTPGDPTRAGYDYLQLDNDVQALQLVAEQTGGLAAWGEVDVVKLLPRIEQDLTSYYSLAYRATTTSEDSVRKIVVQAKNRDYTVRSRTQVIEKSDNTKMKDRVVSALFQQTDGAIPIQLRLGQRVSKGNGRFIVPLSIEIPVRSLTALMDGKTSRGAFSVYLALGDSLGSVGDVTQRTQPFGTADMHGAKDGVFRYEFDLLTDGRISRIAVGVYDEVTREYGLQHLDLPLRASGRRSGAEAD